MLFIFIYIFSPQAWVRPDLYLDLSIKQQFLHGWTGATLTNGNFIYAQDITWNYLLTWFSYKLPIIFILGFLIFTFKKLKGENFSIIANYSYFYLFYVHTFFDCKAYCYDGLRQYLFLVPYFVIILQN